jgi:hypothetical protein
VRSLTRSHQCRLRVRATASDRLPSGSLRPPLVRIAPSSRLPLRRDAWAARLAACAPIKQPARSLRLGAPEKVWCPPRCKHIHSHTLRAAGHNRHNEGLCRPTSSSHTATAVCQYKAAEHPLAVSYSYNRQIYIQYRLYLFISRDTQKKLTYCIIPVHSTSTEIVRFT